MSKAAQAAADVLGLCLIKIDGTSAFNLQKRPVAFQAMYRAAPRTATALAQFYQHASLKLVQVGKGYQKLWVNTGWEQGDPGAPQGFAFGMDVSLRALAHDLEECLTRTLGPDMRYCFRAWSYLDDLIVGVPPSRGTGSTRADSLPFGRIRLPNQLEKAGALLHHPPPPPT